jgi:hypothetical protein
MNLLEFFEDLPGHRTEKDDNTAVKLSDVRKTVKPSAYYE